MSNILFQINKLPLSICTRTTLKIQDNEKLIQANICINNNKIELLPIIPEEDIYLEQHNASEGSTWKNHNILFAQFVKNTTPTKIFEIAGGSGNIFKRYTDIIPWTIVDLNPTIKSNSNLNVLCKKFTYSDLNNCETVIASHFFEHIANHEEFLLELKGKNVKNFIISIPNMLEYLKSNFPVLHFEHPVLVTDNYINFLCNKTGWSIVRKQLYKKHSIFYHLQPAKKEHSLEKYCIDNDISILTSFFTYINNRVNFLQKYKFYFFGAHFPLYYFLSAGLSEKNILGVIDNDPNKQNKRMYGLNIFTHNPTDIPAGSNVCVDMGPYTKEIRKNSPPYVFI